MRDDPAPEAAARRYSAAHAAHYAAGHLREAIELYRAIVADYPDAREAGYSRSQIENIVRSVVPQGELLEAGMDLALAHLGRERRA